MYVLFLRSFLDHYPYIMPRHARKHPVKETLCLLDSYFYGNHDDKVCIQFDNREETQKLFNKTRKLSRISSKGYLQHCLFLNRSWRC